MLAPMLYILMRSICCQYCVLEDIKTVAYLGLHQALLRINGMSFIEHLASL